MINIIINFAKISVAKKINNKNKDVFFDEIPPLSDISFKKIFR